jgi:hypothetical protein
MLRQVDAGALRPIVDRVFPLSRGRETVAYLAERRQFGKVVVVPDARTLTPVGRRRHDDAGRARARPQAQRAPPDGATA